MSASRPKCHDSYLPFDSDRKRMTVIRRRQATVGLRQRRARSAARPLHPHAHPEGWRCCRERPGPLLSLCVDGQRCPACARPCRAATRRVSSRRKHDGRRRGIEQGLTLLGLIGLQDPPRAEARDAVTRCKRAGIRVVMITAIFPTRRAPSPGNSASWSAVIR